jgi:predicted RNA-binding protein YlqC (UPF0109 family)
MSDEQKFIDVGTKLLQTVASSLVDNEDEIEVDVSSGNFHTTVFTLKCEKSDLGKLIGKKGRTATAMRNIRTPGRGLNICIRLQRSTAAGDKKSISPANNFSHII